MGTLFSRFRKSFSTLWVGVAAQLSTSTSSETVSSSAKLSPPLMKKMADLLLENERLKEELRLIELERDCEHDV
jgi:hypothetical protein